MDLGADAGATDGQADAGKVDADGGATSVDELTLIDDIHSPDLSFNSYGQAVVTSDRRWIYVTSEVGSDFFGYQPGSNNGNTRGQRGGIAVLRMEENGALRLTQQTVGLNDVADLLLSSDESKLIGLRANGEVRVWSRRDDGRLVEDVEKRLQLENPGRPTFIFGTSDRSQAYIVDTGPDWRVFVLNLSSDATPSLAFTYDPSSISQVGALDGFWISPDNEHCYSVNRSDGTIARWDRALDGSLAFRDTTSLNVDAPVQGALIGSPDGAHLYAFTNEQVLTLARNTDGMSAGFGDITAAATLERQADSGQVFPGGVAIQHDALFVGTGIVEDGSTETQAALEWYRRDGNQNSPAFGALQTQTVLEGLGLREESRVEGIAAFDDKLLALTVSIQEARTVSPYESGSSIDLIEVPAAGTSLQRQGRVEDESLPNLRRLSDFAMHPNGRWLYGVGGLIGQFRTVLETDRIVELRGVSVFHFEDNSLSFVSEALCFDEDDRRTDGCAVRGLTVASDGLSAGGFGSGGQGQFLIIYDIDQATGELSVRSTIDDSAPFFYRFSAPLDVAFSPNTGRDGSVYHYVDGTAIFGALVPDGPGTINGLGGLAFRDAPALRNNRGVDATNDNQFAYVVTEDAVVALTTFPYEVLETYPFEDFAPGASTQGQRVLLSPDERHLYVAADRGATIWTFARNMDGRLSYLAHAENRLGGVGETHSTAFAIDHGYGLAFDEAGQTLVLSANISLDDLDAPEPDGFAVFDREPTSGALTHRATYRQLNGTAANLSGIVGIDLSPDGNTVFTGAGADKAVSAFAIPLEGQ